MPFEVGHFQRKENIESEHGGQSGIPRHSFYSFLSVRINRDDQRAAGRVVVTHRAFNLSAITPKLMQIASNTIKPANPSMPRMANQSTLASTQLPGDYVDRRAQFFTVHISQKIDVANDGLLPDAD